MKGLPWIRLDTDLREHEKADRLADALGERRAWTYVVELWMWAGANRPDGDLSQMPDSGIARRSGYEGDGAAFVKALQVAGFLTDDRQIYGWADRQGTLVAKFERDRKKPDGRKGTRGITGGSTPPAPVPVAPVANPARDTGGIGAAPARLPHGDVDGDVDEKSENKHEARVRVAASVPTDPFPAQPQVTHAVDPTEPDAGRPPATPSVPAAVAEVWAQYRELVPDAALTIPREELVRRWLRTYSPEQLRRSLVGYARSGWHGGANDTGRRVLEIEVLWRTAGGVEKGWSYLDAKPVRSTGPPGRLPPMVAHDEESSLGPFADP